ncbi:lipid II flippase family protein [Effusibacillus consociatus]|uniref:Lipid II flippase family protein n=1 Tax=Effusibacillus consociatus TaxID=1117041 RepID=A0ABV9Q0K6_9BACL
MEWFESITGGQIGIGHLLFVFLMIALTNFFDTTSYAARLAGVRTKQLAVANSLFAMLTFGSRTTTALYLPAIAGIAQRAINQGFDPLFPLQFVLLGAAVGTAAGIALLPATDKFYELGISRMEQQGTAIGVFKSLCLKKSGLRDLAACWRWPKWSMWKGISLAGVPKDMIFMNAILYAFFTVGSIATYYAGSLHPEVALTATGLAPAINAVGAFLLLFLVDPRGAIIMDQGIQRKVPMEVVKSSMVYLALSRFAGTVLSILVLYPAALFVAWLAKFF